jgi:hypothetical protein
VSDVDDREALLETARIIVKSPNLLRYGVAEVSEEWLTGLSDSALADIVERDRLMCDIGY